MNNYYDTLGEILRKELDNNTNPFETIKKHHKMTHTTSQHSTDHTHNSIKRIQTPQELNEDFATLQLLPGMPFAECKRSWKRLAKRYHPDTAQANNDIDANIVIRRINHAYKRIQTWFKTGIIIDEFKP